MPDLDRVFVVSVPTDENDPLVAFRDRTHAERFRDAMQADGHDAVLTEEPLIGDKQAEDMISASSPPVEQPRFRVHRHEEGWATIDSKTSELRGTWESRELAVADAIVLNHGWPPEVIDA